jgi:hypothetical protein
MKGQESATSGIQVSGIQCCADVFKMLFAVRRAEWTTISKRPGLPQRLQRLIILLRRGQIAGFQILRQLLEIGAAMVKEAL